MNSKKKSITKLWQDMLAAISENGNKTTPVLQSAPTKSIYIHHEKSSRRRSARVSKYYCQLDDEAVHFSKREVQTMELIMDGLTVPKAAGKLNLSPRTVEFYVKNLRSKLKCVSKRELVLLLKQQNILDKIQQE